ncbi:MAG: lantibiotic dehydratase [Pseudonocardiaceae bacterium]
MTPEAFSPKAAERSGSASQRDSLYVPLGWGLLRAPLLAVDAAVPAGTAEPGASLLPSDSCVRAAIAVASTDLTAALARIGPGDRKARRVRGKLLRYLIRMSTRPTPYGLFAGVGLVEWGPKTDVALALRPPRTRTRPDMEWLLDLVASLERDPDIRRGLRLVASRAVVVRGGRAFSMSGQGRAISVRATGAVRRALELARVPISPTTLADELSAAPSATPEKVERLIDELWRQGFLLSDLSLPLTGADPATYLRERLAGIPATAAADGLGQLLEALAAWDVLPLEDRAESWPGLLNRARTVHPSPQSTNLLQTDLALPLAGTRLHAAVGAEAARAGELLVRLSPYPGGLAQLDGYRHAFEARYGPDRLVPLLELVDPDFGLGLTGTPNRDSAGPQVGAQRQQLLRDIALDANRDRRLVVELDEGLLARLETSKPQATTVPPSLDISVFVAASSPEAIDAGNFQVVIGPNLGASAAGRNLGRFADLLGPRALAALKEAANAEAALAPHCILAEVVYLPQRARWANVSIRPAVRTREIVIGTLPGVADEDVVPVNELVVGLRAGRFIVRWPAGDAEVVGVQGHMLSPRQAPPAARFLLDVASDGHCQLASFDWGPATAFSFLPRVQCGRVILALAQWQVDPAAEQLVAKTGNSFAEALATWRARWSVPRHVYLAVGDNRLLLDLDDVEHAELLGDELRRVPQGASVLLQEALPGPAHAWLPGPGGGHIAEVVVPVKVREPPAPPAKPAQGDAKPVSARVRLRPPGSDWLYLKLYGPKTFEDELIAGPLRSFGEFAVSNGLSDGWFFLRYTDPDPHLRVRFHGTPTVLLGQLMQQVCTWATELVADGACTRFAFDTYEREVERYGGEDGIRVAEAVFTADSPAVARILHLSRQGGLSYDRMTVAVLSIDDLLAAVGLDAGQRTDVYRDATALSHDDGEKYRGRQRELRQLLGRPGVLTGSPTGQAFASILATRRSALAPAATLLNALERDGRLHHPCARLCRSYIHLHANRLLGSDPPLEGLALRLLRRTREGLRRAPVV